MMEAGPFRTLPACGFETDLGVDCPGFVEVQQFDRGKAAKLLVTGLSWQPSIDSPRRFKPRQIMRAAYRRPFGFDGFTTNVSHWHTLHGRNFFLQRCRTCHSYQWLDNIDTHAPKGPDVRA